MSSYQALKSGLREVVRKNGQNHQLPVNTLVDIDVLLQQLKLYQGGCLTAVYPVSTSVNGVGSAVDSGCTPSGWHIVRKKIGAAMPKGTVFRGRVPAGVAASLKDNSREDLITSRILWLDGLENGLNRGAQVDSFSRYIYIHGTAQEHLIGRAVSNGCVRMTNTDVIALFDWVDVNTPVLISPNNN